MPRTHLVGFRRPSTLRFMEQILRGEIATGVSSEALAQHALGIAPLSRPGTLAQNQGVRPLDRGDFGRCMKTYHAAPKHLQRKMRWVLDDWALVLRQEAGYNTEDYRSPDVDYRDASKYDRY